MASVIRDRRESYITRLRKLISSAEDKDAVKDSIRARLLMIVRMKGATPPTSSKDAEIDAILREMGENGSDATAVAIGLGLAGGKRRTGKKSRRRRGGDPEEDAEKLRAAAEEEKRKTTLPEDEDPKPIAKADLGGRKRRSTRKSRKTRRYSRRH
jgi:hypothetical protein